MRNPSLANNVLSDNSNTEFNLEDALDLRMIASYLENLADAAENLSQAIIEQNEKIKSYKKIPRKNIEDTLLNLKSLLQESFNSYVENDSEIAMSTLNSLRKIEKALKLKIKNSDDPIYELAEELFECVKDIADLVGE